MPRSFTIAGRRFGLDRALVERTLRGELPEPIRDHYVVVGARRFPPKQVLGAATGLDRADFTTHQARRVLLRLGFSAARQSADAREPSATDGAGTGPHGGRQAEVLRPYVGQWVALGAPLEVLVAADTPQEVISWLARHGKRATGMFRVPSSEAEAGGLAPL